MAKARDAVQQSIIKMIQRDEIAPGEVLSPSALSEKLDVSVNTILQAFRHFEGMGVLEHMDDGATRVRSYTVYEMDAAYALRESLEGVAARYCAQFATEEELAVLEVRARRIEEKVARGEWPEAEEFAFHQGVIQFSHLPLIQHFEWASVFLPLLFRRTVYRETNRDYQPDQMRGDHSFAYNAIASRDPDRAEKMMREHVAGARARLAEVLAKTLLKKEATEGTVASA